MRVKCISFRIYTTLYAKAIMCYIPNTKPHDALVNSQSETL